MRKNSKGWYNEPVRHGLAAQGVETTAKGKSEMSDVNHWSDEKWQFSIDFTEGGIGIGLGTGPGHIGPDTTKMMSFEELVDWMQSDEVKEQLGGKPEWVEMNINMSPSVVPEYNEEIPQKLEEELEKRGIEAIIHS